MNSKKNDILKNKKAMLGTLIGLTIFIVIGSIGKTQNELKAIIKEAEVYLNNGEISGAENVLRAKAGETNNREFKKLWSIVYGYEQASNKLYLYDDIEGTKEMLDKIDNSYKNYEPVKEKIDKLIGDMESIELVRAEADNVIEQVEKLLEDNKPEEALEIVYEIEGKEGQTKKQKDKLLSLRVKSEDMKWANIDLEREEKRKKQDEEFTVDKAIEYAENYSLRHNIDTIRVEVDETPQYDEDGRKYYNVGVYIIELDELNEVYRVYSDGEIRDLE